MDRVLNNMMIPICTKQNLVLTLLKAGFSLIHSPNSASLKHRFHEELDMAYIHSYFVQVGFEVQF